MDLRIDIKNMCSKCIIFLFIGLMLQGAIFAQNQDFEKKNTLTEAQSQQVQQLMQVLSVLYPNQFAINQTLFVEPDPDEDYNEVTENWLTYSATDDTLTTDSHESDYLESAMDSMMSLWNVKKHYRTEKTQGPKEIEDVADSVYLDRLNQLPSIFKLSYNQIVRRFIEMYTQKRSEQVSVMLGLSEYYFPFFEEALDAEGLPIELKYLPVIESALNPRARSRAGATGLWQFMYYTAKMFKVEMNSYVDERCDPLKSTQAATQYLKYLYSIYKDWPLVIAAYNCGPGNVNKAIRRSGGKRNYWEIYNYLPRETRGYVPAFIAATYAMNYYEKHNISPVKFVIPQSDTVHITDRIHFGQIAEVVKLPVEQIRELNPQYRKDIIPATSSRKYILRLPADKALDFIDLKDSVLAYKDSVFFNKKLVVEPAPRSRRKYSYSPPAPPKNKAKVYYTVQPGDNVGTIADLYDVRASSLRYWNNIYRNRIYAGKKLVVYVSKNKVSHYKRISSMSYEQKMALIGKSSQKDEPQTASNDIASNDNFVYYKIRHGENLWIIAKKFPGVSNIDIMKLNGLDFEEVKNLKPGQVLKIKPKKG